jgi:hypothetical protein
VTRSIVNGLRGDDNESFYGDRASFASEYSLRDGPNDGVQLHFKEHVRSGSKGSMSSFVSSKNRGRRIGPKRRHGDCQFCVGTRNDLADGDLGVLIGVLQ